MASSENIVTGIWQDLQRQARDAIACGTMYHLESLVERWSSLPNTTEYSNCSPPTDELQCICSAGAPWQVGTMQRWQ